MAINRNRSIKNGDEDMGLCVCSKGVAMIYCVQLLDGQVSMFV